MRDYIYDVGEEKFDLQARSRLGTHSINEVMSEDRAKDRYCVPAHPAFLCVDFSKEWLLAKKRDTPFGKRVKVSNYYWSLLD